MKPEFFMERTDECLDPGKAISESPIWENSIFAARFESLVQFTNRPSLIRQLIDLPDGVNDKVLRKHIRQVEDRFGIERRVPRGKQALFSTSLKKPLERYHASLLYSLMRSVGLEEAVVRGAYCDYILELYQRYLHVTGQNADAAIVTFDEMMEIRSAVTTSQIAILNCWNCGSVHISHSPDANCPFCALHNHQTFNQASSINHYQSMQLGESPEALHG